MEQYNVFIVALKEILEKLTLIKIVSALSLCIITYRLPEIITAIRLWKD